MTFPAAAPLLFGFIAAEILEPMASDALVLLARRFLWGQTTFSQCKGKPLPKRLSDPIAPSSRLVVCARRSRRAQRLDPLALDVQRRAIRLERVARAVPDAQPPEHKHYVDTLSWCTVSAVNTSELEDPPVFTAEFAALLAATLVFGLAHSAYFLLPKYLELELHANPSEIGGISSLTWFANVALVGFVGIWVDRRGRLPFAFVGAALMTLTAAGFLAVDSLGPWLVFLRVAHGFAFTLFFVAASTLTADLAPPRRLGQALGIFGVMTVSTSALAPAASEWLANVAGWDAVFAATAGMAALSGLLLLAVRERPHTRGETREIPGLRSVFARPGMTPILLVSGLAGVTFGAMFTFHQPYALSLGISRVSDFLVAYSIAAVIVRGLFGGVADRLGRLQVARFALAIYGVSPIAMVLLGAMSFWWIGALLGLAHGLFYPALNAVIVDGAEDDVRGKVMAVYNGAFNVGFSFGSLALGYVAQAAGYGLVFVLGGVCSFAALALLARRAPAIAG